MLDYATKKVRVRTDKRSKLAELNGSFTSTNKRWIEHTKTFYTARIAGLA
jgi:hypothetical protein